MPNDPGKPNESPLESVPGVLEPDSIHDCRIENYNLAGLISQTWEIEIFPHMSKMQHPHGSSACRFGKEV